MKKEMNYPRPSRRTSGQKPHWDKHRIKALREHLRLTQSEMASELQVRQQTISEWETGLHIPHRSTQKILSMVAESTGFTYTVTPSQPASSDSNQPFAEQSSSLN